MSTYCPFVARQWQLFPQCGAQRGGASAVGRTRGGARCFFDSKFKIARMLYVSVPLFRLTAAIPRSLSLAAKVTTPPIG